MRHRVKGQRAESFVILTMIALITTAMECPFQVILKVIVMIIVQYAPVTIMTKTNN